MKRRTLIEIFRTLQTILIATTVLFTGATIGWAIYTGTVDLGTALAVNVTLLTAVSMWLAHYDYGR